MSRKLLILSLTTALSGGLASAKVPQVAVDIAPVHSLVTRVMDGVGAPNLVIQVGASPHEYNLRPSEAQALQDANLVFWIGSDLTPWLADAIQTLAPNAVTTALLESEGTIELEFRESALFEAHAHDDHDEDKHADHDDHDDHDEDKHADHDDHDDHDEDKHADHDDHGAHDPHAWLSPQNAKTWLNVIASKLSAADPKNAGIYFSNAAAGQTEIDALIAEVNATLEPVRGMNFIVFHDAYQYFENDFDFPASGAISIADASDPSPARIQEIQVRISNEGIDCVLAEPQFNPGLVATVMDGSEAKTGILDPLGAGLQPGAKLYPELIRNLSKALTNCL
ncbi:MAG: zinc ABC transporter substrate-binding protein [Amylibacter sp.]|nr:zinc ABC transporter substrate-binding protein [Amylibacter sp.]